MKPTKNSSNAQLTIVSDDDQSELILQLLKRQEEALEQLDQLDLRVIEVIEEISASRAASQPAA